jgi:hypothetical protein
MIVDSEYGTYSRKTSAVRAEEADNASLVRLTTSTNVAIEVSPETAAADTAAVTSAYSRTSEFYRGTNILIEGDDADKPTSSQSDPVPFGGTVVPAGYKFNLPPHSWSLPLRPTETENEYVGNTTYADFHGLRRGRIWYFQGAGDISEKNTENSQSSAEKMLLDRNYGFQFLWNPETISTNVARNMDITPSAADTLRVVAGVFPGQETMSVTVVIDRTNDFAYGKSIGLPDPTYYSTGFPLAEKQDFITQWRALIQQGTMADLEYLFRAINGSGSGDKQWTTLLGKKTANVGYLQPTLMGISLGPDVHENLSYVGWISNISINHTAFTETMIPLRTSVNISFECFSGSGISAG